MQRIYTNAAEDIIPRLFFYKTKKMKNVFSVIINFFDPHKRGPLFTRYGVTGVLFISAVTIVLYMVISRPGGTLLGSLLGLLTIGVHEAGHPLFSMISGGNEFLTIIGGTVMEIIVPFAAFLYFQRKGQEIQAAVCLLLLAIAFKSIGHYSGAQHLDDYITLVNATEDSLGDWHYMHKWFGTGSIVKQIRVFFYLLSAFTAAVGFWLLVQNIRSWFKSDKLIDEESDSIF